MRTLFCFSTLIGVCLLVLSVQKVCADSGAAYLVSPSKADAVASPLTYRTIQTSTESDNSGLFLKPGAPPIWLRFGIDSYITGNSKLYDLPVSYAVTPDLQVQLNIPVVTAETDLSSAGSSSETGLGDIRLSIRYRTALDESFESYFILTTKFSSGDPDSGLGTGSYDFSFTHKSIFMLGDYRTTLMAGLTIPPPFDFDVKGSSVVYGPSIACMAATEREFSSTGLRLGIKAAGLHVFDSRINSELQKNAVTAVDLIPEVAYRISKNLSINAGIIVPVLTIYDLPGAENRRDNVYNLGVHAFF